MWAQDGALACFDVSDKLSIVLTQQLLGILEEGKAHSWLHLHYTIVLIDHNLRDTIHKYAEVKPFIRAIVHMLADGIVSV